MIYKLNKDKGDVLEVFQDKSELSDLERETSEKLSMRDVAENVYELSEHEKEIMDSPNALRFTIDPDALNMTISTSRTDIPAASLYYAANVFVSRLYTTLCTLSPEYGEAFRKGIIATINSDDFWAYGKARVPHQRDE